MSTQDKAKKTGILFIALLIVAGLVLLYRGNDAVVLGAEKKEGILTAEQVKLAFDSVGGRMVKEAVQEGQDVKQGDIIMQIDPTDTDLAIARLRIQIAQVEAQISGVRGTQGIQFDRADTDLTQSLRQVDQQQAAVSAAEATLRNRAVDYERKAALVAAGAVAQNQLDDAQMALDVAEANVTQQRNLLNKLLAGATAGGEEGTMLPAVAQARKAAANMGNEIEALAQQKAALEVQLRTLEVQKERLTLRAPEDGRILSVLAKEGEMVAPGVPVVLMESKRMYYDIYLSESQIHGLREGDSLTGRTVAGDREVRGKIRLITQAPGFADLKQSREKGQADLTAFQIRTYVDAQSGVMPGMTIGVEAHEFTKR